MQMDALVRPCDTFDRRTNPRSTCYRGAATSAMVDGGRKRRPGRGEKGGQDEIRRAPSGHPDRLRLFLHSLWKSWTRFEFLSRRFDESREKKMRIAVEKFRYCGR